MTTPAPIRTAVNNPFAPGSGSVPEVWVGRDDELADVDRRLVPRRRAGLFERGRAFLGDPGIGKSVLVNRIADELIADGNLVTPPLRLAGGRDPLAALAGALEPLTATGERGATRVTDAIGRVRDVGLLGARVSVTAPAEDRYASLAALLDAILDHAEAHDRLLAIRIDEIQNLSGDPLSQLLTILGDALEATTTSRGPAGDTHVRHRPLIVLLSGLPSFTKQAADAGATFARRFATAYLEPFDDLEIRAALRFTFDDGFDVLTDDGPAKVHIEDAAIDEIVAACLGEPFLFQLAGAAAWDADVTAVITAEDVRAGWARARREVHAHVRSRTDGLTELQRSVLTAAAGAPQGADGTRIAQSIGRSASSDIGSTLQALVRKRLLRLDDDGYHVISRALARELNTGD